MRPNLKELPDAKHRGRTYEVGKFYKLLKGEGCGSICKLAAIQEDHTPGILTYNKKFLVLVSGDDFEGCDINLQVANEYLEEVKVSRCPCPHGSCLAWVEKDGA